ncbi:hypothetical protein [Desulfoluna sp.]|uniref:hypothetical protein n=1 Tax=Desulfoluna sp. TaxID=2045199 RepID=UPI00262177A6|nr:hypothetical protein [Desulfoluna sp.]
MENCVKSIELENGLILKVEDTSRRISEDAFVVKVRFTISFQISEEEAGALDLSLPELTKMLGSAGGRFEKEREKNFVKEAQKDEVFKEMTDSYLHTNLSYLSHPGFKKGVIRRCLAEKRGRY